MSVIVVTHNNGQDVSELVGSLRSQTRDQSVRVIVCDNESTDDTVETLQKEKDIHLVRANGNLGYSGGINTAYQHVGQCASILVLNPDLTVRPNAVSAMLARLRTPGVGVVAPRILGAEGKVYPSLRREPTILRALGDAVLGRRLSARPRWLSEMDHAAQSYTLAHKIDWATGAALLIRREVADSIGNWNETFFLYSEEIDYCRRIREAGYQIWFEPDAEVQHKGAGSGTSPALATLMSVNRVRYAELHHTRYYAGVYRSTVALAEAVRSYDRYHRNTLSFVVNRKRWVELPQLAKSQPT